MGVALIVIGAILLIAASYLTVAELKKFYKSGSHELSKVNLRNLGIFLGVLGLGGLALNLGIALACVWSIDPWHMVMLLGGGLLFFPSFCLFFITFYLRYWRKDLVEKQQKTNGLLMVISIIASFFTFLLAGEGMGPYLYYPLVSGFVINNQGFQWTRPNVAHGSGFAIAWYGVIILGAAILAYRISDHHFYQKYGRHGILDTCFLIAFPAGIIGARIWYVVGNWNGDAAGGISFAEEVAKGNWGSIFAIWNGGLTILGGAVGGILGGMIYMLLARKYVDIRFAFDAVVPTILIAQAIGRFGNFFNHEVYGAVTDMSAWPLLPTWIKNNMATAWVDGAPASTNMYVPLFLIEAIINIFGYFFIAYIFPAFWKWLSVKITHKEDGGALKLAMGDKVGFYLIWYGITRMIMEPLRDVNYNMGTNGMWSFWNSMVYIILGALAVTALQWYAHYRKAKGLPEETQRGQPKEALVTGEKKENAPQKANDLAKPKPIGKANDLAKPKPIGQPKADEESKEGE